MATKDCLGLERACLRRVEAAIQNGMGPKQLREGYAHGNVHLEGLLIERWMTEYCDVHFTAAHQAQHNLDKKLKRRGYFPFWLGFLGILREQTANRNCKRPQFVGKSACACIRLCLKS